MRTIQIGISSLFLLMSLVFTGNPAAQGKSPALLNELEVQQLVKRAEPADSARLATHFSALAERYAAEATRHTSMSKSFVGNPNRSLGTGMSTHCKQLAGFNTQSATTLREAAAYHQKLAGGAKPTPTEGSRFDEGVGARVPTDQELNAMAAKAGSAGDHRALEDYFLTLAKRYTAEASQHTTLAATYRGTRNPQGAVYHDRAAGLARDSAKAATAGAEMHKQLAGGK